MKTCSACNINYPDVVEFCPHDGNRLPPNPHETQAMYDPLIGSTIDGRYIIEQVIGQGGMGFVYAARHAIIDKRVAIKVLKKEHGKDAAAVERFLVEAKAASKIGHQNIVDITDFGVLPDGHAYFVMEFLDGPTLGKLVHERGFIEPLQAIAITVQVARGLQAAHDKGIIHRDLKPENIFVLERDGQKDVVKIVDFGIARDVTTKKRLTLAGMVLGTPEYMSPEQATGQPTDHRVDMYALGCILYEMLTGDVPYKGETPTKTLTMHVFDAPQPPSQRRPDLPIAASLEAVVMRTLQKKPADRFADLRAMMAELDRVDAELRGPSKPKPARAPTITQAPATEPNPIIDDEVPRSSGRLGLIVAAAAVLLLAVVGMALAVGGKKKPVVVEQLPQPAAPPSAAPLVQPAAMPSPASEEAARKDVEIVLRSDPPGAEVFEGVERLGVSPVTIRRARSSQALTFSLRRAGYQDIHREVVPDRDRDVEVLLAPKHDRVADSRKHGSSASKAVVAQPAPGHPTPAPPPPKKTSDLRNPFE
ncbi:MAG TPA: serine/threonine-protein kinase [Polyangia bacterium]|nr:serine/threonine-protein kinase [Polyangia bacterium]